METIIVEIFIPAVSASFDFRLPASGRICDITEEIIRILEATQQNLRFDRDMPMLCDIDHGCMLDPGKTISETGIKDSSRLMLV